MHGETVKLVPMKCFLMRFIYDFAHFLVPGTFIYSKSTDTKKYSIEHPLYNGTYYCL